jgi:hypothetical protein
MFISQCQKTQKQLQKCTKESGNNRSYNCLSGVLSHVGYYTVTVSFNNRLNDILRVGSV